jgi:hypothetical protein
MSKRLAKFRPAKGIANDIEPYALGPDYWSHGSNVNFRPFASRVLGFDNVYGTIQNEVRSLLNARLGGINYWLYNGKSTSHVVTGTTHTNITIAAGLTTVSALNQWSVVLLNSIPIANNGVDPPMYWDGNTANDMLVLPGWPAGSSCYTMRAWRNFLLAINMSTAGGNYPDQVKWSNSAAAGAVPTSWTAAATNDAGDATLADTPGALLDGWPLGSGFVLYKARSAYVAEYVQGNFVMAFRRLPIGRGVLSRNCVADFNGRHFVVGEGDIFLTDGNTVEPLATNRMKRFLFNQLDQTSYKACFVARNPAAGEYLICFPSAGSTLCDLALVWASETDSWGVRELPDISCAVGGIVSDTAPDESWDGDSGTWDSDATTWHEQGYSEAQETLVMGAPNDAAPTSSLFLEVDSGTDANGSSIAASIAKYSMDLGDASRVKLVRRIYPHITAAVGTTVYVRVGSQMQPDGAITWGAEVAYVVGDNNYVDLFSQGRFISVEFRSDGGAVWVLPGFDVEFEPRGYH